MLQINRNLSPEGLKEKLERFWKLSGEKIRLIQIEYDSSNGSPVFTAEGKYTTRGWTEWTQGFQFGSSILQFDATGDPFFLDYGKENTLTAVAQVIRITRKRKTVRKNTRVIRFAKIDALR